jgi:hypothetical protein
LSGSEKRLIQEIEGSRLYLKEALDVFRGEIDRLDQKDALELASQIIEEGKVFSYLQIVGYILRKNAMPNDGFFSVLKKAIEKTSRDMAQPWLLNDLVEVGLQNPELGLEIYKKAKELNDPHLLLACRWIFGGVGANDFRLIYKILLKDIEAAEPELRIASVSAIRIAFAKGLMSDWKTQVFSFLDSKQDDPDQRVRKELLNTYITLYGYAKEPCFAGILFLCKNDNQLNFDASNLLLHKELTTEHYLEMIEFLSSSQDKSVIEMVLLSFYSWAKKEIIEPELQIIYDLLKRFSYFDIRQIEEALNELGKADLETCLRYLYCWLEDANARIRFHSLFKIGWHLREMIWRS